MEVQGNTISSIESRFHSDNYELLDKVGEGGFGQIYKAEQRNTGQLVAIKFLTLNPDFDKSKKRRYIERFERETLLSSRLQHPNVVRLLDKGVCDDELLYAVFEYVDGKSLKQVLTETGALPPVEAAMVMGQVLDALTHAHEQGVIHRDIKPANIMLTKAGAKTHVKVLDFGIGTLIQEARHLDYKSITLTQETLGTPSYSAPEQLRGEPPTPQTDLYVWGLVFIECLTGGPAISGSSLASIFHKQLSQSNVPLPAAIAGHPVASLLRRALNKKTTERVAKASDLYAELSQLNFSTLVGEINEGSSSYEHLDTATKLSSGSDDTVINEFGKSYTRLTERKQITVLCVSLNVKSTGSVEVDHEVIDALHRDQKAKCVDVAVRYGGFHVGTLGDTLLFYFGYPSVSDNDCRLAARTALEISSSMSKRNILLRQSQGIEAQVSMGMHTGLVTTYADAVPEGDTPNVAMELARFASSNQVLCSSAVKKRLDTYLEFRAGGVLAIGIDNQQAQLYSLVSERQVEAFGFLRANRRNNELIGREEPLAALLSLLEIVDQQENKPDVQAAHVYGEAGIGKSRLIFELRDNAQSFNQYVAQCLPEHENNALYPILNVIRYKYSLESVESGIAVNKLRQVLSKLDGLSEQDSIPVLCSWLSLPLPDDLAPIPHAPDVQKQILFQSLTHLLCESNESELFGSTLFIYEDMHWSDPTSIEFIRHLVSSPTFSASKSLLVSTSRKVLPETLGSSGLINVRLEKLSDSETISFVNYLFDKQKVSDNLSEIVVSRTDGIPLFIEELVNMLKQNKLVQHINGIIDFVSPDVIDEVPTSLRDSLQQKLDTLVYSKETAQLASTIGREFNYKLLAASSNKSEEQVQIDLTELLESELIYLQRKVTGDSYIFKHALVRDAAYESMTSNYAQESHLRVGKAIEAKFPDIIKEQPFLVAQHFSKAESYIHAFGYGDQAIYNLAKNSFNFEALEVGKKVQSWIDNISESDPLKYECQIKLNSTIIPISTKFNGWGHDDLKLLADQSIELISNLDSVSNTVLSVPEIEQIKYKSDWTLFIYNHYRGERVIARKLGEKLLKKTVDEGDRVKELIVSTTLGQAYFFDGDFKMALSLLSNVIKNYDFEKDLHLNVEYGFDPYHFSAGNLMSISAITGDLDEAIRYRNLCLGHAVKTENIPTVITGYTWGTCYYFLTYDRAGMTEWCNNALSKHGDKFEDTWILKYFNMNYDWTKYEYERSAQTVKEEVASGQDGILSWYDPLLSDTYINRGMYDDALSVIQNSLDRSLKSGDKCTLPITYRHLAIAHFHKSGYLCEKTMDGFEKSIEEAKLRGSSWLELLSTYELFKLMSDVDEKNNLRDRLSSLLSTIKCSFENATLIEIRGMLNIVPKRSEV